MTIVTIVAGGRTDVGIVARMGRMLVARRRVAPLVKEFSTGMTGDTGLGAGAEGIGLPGIDDGIVAAVGTAAIGVGEIRSGIIKSSGQIGATEIDRAIIVICTTRAGIGRMTGTTARRHWRTRVVGVNRGAFIGPGMIPPEGDMAAVTVTGWAAGDHLAGPAIDATVGRIIFVGVGEAVLAITRPVGAGTGVVAAITGVDGRVVVGKEHVVVDLNRAIAMLDGEVVGDGRALLEGVAHVALVDTVMTGLNLGISTMTGDDPTGPAAIEITVAVTTLGIITVTGGDIPLAIPGPTIVMTGRQSGGRSTGGG